MGSGDADDVEFWRAEAQRWRADAEQLVGYRVEAEGLAADNLVLQARVTELEGDNLWCWAHIRRYFIRAGSADELATYAAHLPRGDPTDPRIRQSYAEHLDEQPHETAWPPRRNETCWCGSATKYKKCCLPRSRR